MVGGKKVAMGWLGAKGAGGWMGARWYQWGEVQVWVGSHHFHHHVAMPAPIALRLLCLLMTYSLMTHS